MMMLEIGILLIVVGLIVLGIFDSPDSYATFGGKPWKEVILTIASFSLFFGVLLLVLYFIGSIWEYLS